MTESGPATVRLRQLGVLVRHEPERPSRVWPRSADVLICDANSPATDPARLSAMRRDLPVWTTERWQRRLLRQPHGLAVVGKRAASTASAMIGWTLIHAGLDPTLAVLRTAATQLGGSARQGDGPYSVVEMGSPGKPEEWGTLSPSLALLLDLELPPGRRDSAMAATRALAASVPATGLLLAWGGSASLREVLEGWERPIEWLGTEPGADWWAADLREDRGRFRFRVFRTGRFVVEVRLPLPGARNVFGALAAVAVGTRFDLPAREIQQALEEFRGISRDFESRGSYRGVTLIDDQGDGPAQIGETLGLVRRVFGGRRVWSVLPDPDEPVRESPGRVPTTSRRSASPAVSSSWGGRRRRIGREGVRGPGGGAGGGRANGPPRGRPRRRDLGTGPASRTRRRAGDARGRRRGNDSRCIHSTTSARSSQADEPLAPHIWFRLGRPGRVPGPAPDARRAARPAPPLPRRAGCRSRSSAAARTSWSATRGSRRWSSTWRARPSPTSRSTATSSRPAPRSR